MPCFLPCISSILAAKKAVLLLLLLADKSSNADMNSAATVSVSVSGCRCALPSWQTYSTSSPGSTTSTRSRSRNAVDARLDNNPANGLLGLHTPHRKRLRTDSDAPRRDFSIFKLFPAAIAKGVNARRQPGQSAVASLTTTDNSSVLETPGNAAEHPKAEPQPPQSETSIHALTEEVVLPSTSSGATQDEINTLLAYPTLYEPIRKPRNPLVLCHGLYGFDSWGLDILPALRIHYWADVLTVLKGVVGIDPIITGVPG